MAKSKDWIPKQDDDFYNKQKSYFELIVANKVAWGIPDSAVNQMISRRTAYEPLYYKSQEKKDRTAGDVDRHRQSRKTYEKELRTFINSYIRYNPAVPRDEKIAMGIPPRDIEPTPRPAISTVPVVEFKVLRGGEIEVTVRVTRDQTRPSKHPAADAVEVRYAMMPVGELPPEKAAQCAGTQSSKKARFKIRLGEENAGKRLYGFFRWVNISNPANNGPWSDVQTVVIA